MSKHVGVQSEIETETRKKADSEGKEERFRESMKYQTRQGEGMKEKGDKVGSIEKIKKVK